MSFLFLFAFMRLFVLVKFYRKKKLKCLKLPLITSFTILLFVEIVAVAERYLIITHVKNKDLKK